MERIEVESSNIYSIGYDRQHHVLEVQFRRSGGPGPVYRYHGVPPDLWEQFLMSPSKGRFFNDNIKGTFYTVKVEGEDQ